VNQTDSQQTTQPAIRTWAEPLDVVVVGAGFAGIYMQHALREAGFRSVVFEAGSDIGGTWYWNRYPGARCDVDSLDYSYKFSEELHRDWQWSERYAAQEEILRYFHFVAERFDLRRDIYLNTRVTASHYDEASNLWTVRTSAGDVVRARFVIMATGNLSTTNVPAIPGRERFHGQQYHTGNWPKEPVTFAGKRVAVIGTGSSGVQVATEISRQAAQLTVFQRTANFSLPADVPTLDDKERKNYRDNFPQMREIARNSQYGTPYSQALLLHRSALEDDPETRNRIFEERWAMGGAALVRSYNDLLINREANHPAAEFVRAKIREIVKDPQTAAALSPNDHPIGTKRLCLDTGYYEAFNQPHVSLVDLKSEPIEEIVESGIRTSKATYKFDVLVFATGFDAMTGTLLRIDFQGQQGQRLTEKWAAGPRTYLGLMTNGFPNLFLVTGPGSPSITGNVVVSIEQHVEWISECLTFLRDNKLNRIEAALDAQDEWVDHVNALAARTLLPEANSWYMGANIPGKPRVFMPYIGGIGTYRRKCDEVVEAGYKGFEMSAV
jgi:cyclohexanone monooxygenase